VSGTPAFFINGRYYSGAFDLESLTTEIAAVAQSNDSSAPAPPIGRPLAVAA
jgi:hypothetical protein